MLFRNTLREHNNMLKMPKQQSPRRVSRKKHAPDEQTSTISTTPIHPTLQLQSLIGNHATQRMIQRMPTAGTIETALGKPKKDNIFKKNSTKYKLVLDKVRAYDSYLNRTSLGDDMGAIKGQMQQIMTLLNAVKTAVDAYDGDDGRKATYMQNLKPQVQQEMNKVSLVITKYMSSGIPNMKPKLNLVMSGASQVMPQLRDTDKVGNDKGGSSEVTEYGGVNSGYFKGNKDTLYNPGLGLDETMKKSERRAIIDQTLEDKNSEMVEQFGQTVGNEKFGMIANEHRIGVEMVGIDSENARMAKRDVAMSRLNQILGGGVIAKAQLAVQHTGGQQVEGSLMEKAKGKSALKLIQQDGVYDPNMGDVKDQNQPKQVNLQDPKLMQMLSRLQLIDLLAFQVDRNRGNYFIQTDNNGNVIGVTGIDNDYALGTSTKIEGKNQELPGMSRYVDEELAINILNLDPELLRMVMMDLLTEAEIAALLERLQKLQAFLKPLRDQGQLLKPNQWTPAIAKGLLEERKDKYSGTQNYYGVLIDENNNSKGRRL